MIRWPALPLLLVALASAEPPAPAPSALGGLTTFLSPGVLSRGHDAFAGDCDRCHLVFSGIPDARCLGCHEAIADRVAAVRGFHGKHADDGCISCHPDHRGLDFRGTTDEALAAFDHAETGFPIAGAHAPLTCARCHTAPLGEMADSCGDCHEDAHESRRGPDCQKCHTDAGWDRDLKDKDDHLTAMTGGHEPLGCDDCHLYGSNLEQGSIPCSQCHERGHGGTTAPCDECHEVSGWKPAEFDHGPCTCAFPGKHQTVECLACHPVQQAGDGGLRTFVFTGTPTLCGGCHEGDREHEPLGECARCHDATSWSDSQFDHDRAKFTLNDRHLAVSCTQCHPTPGQFRGAPVVCEGCHAEQGNTAHGDFGACARCHTPAGFSPSSFDHATVGFPLTGKHAAAPCQSCHADKVRGYARP